MAVRDNPDDEMEVTFMKEMIFGAAFMICGLLLCLIMAVIYTISSSLNLLGHIIIWAGIIMFIVGLIICVYTLVSGEE